MDSLAAFGIENDGLNVAVNLLLLFLVVLWISLIYWTHSDARRRIEDPMLVGCATAASVFPFIGTLVYVVVRPPEYLDDVRERELETAAARARLASAEQHTCRYCGFDIEKSFLRCPSCLRRLKEPCRACGRPLDPRWKICPYCEAEIGQVRAQPRTRRRAGADSARTQTPRPAATARPTAAPATAAARPSGAAARHPGRKGSPAPAAAASSNDGGDERGARPSPPPEAPPDGMPAEQTGAGRERPRPAG
jgi:Double zinc ribbon